MIRRCSNQHYCEEWIKVPSVNDFDYQQWERLEVAPNIFERFPEMTELQAECLIEELCPKCLEKAYLNSEIEVTESEENY